MTISATIVFFILLVILVRANRTTITTATVAVLAGFTLASTGAAPHVWAFLDAVAAELNRL